MALGRFEADCLIAARVCAGLGTVLNWGGHSFSPSQFMPGEHAAKPAKIDATLAIEALHGVYLR